MKKEEKIMKKEEKIKMTRSADFQLKLSHLWTVKMAGVSIEYLKSVNLPEIVKKKNFWGVEKDVIETVMLELFEPLDYSYYNQFRESSKLNIPLTMEICYVDVKGVINNKFKLEGCTIKKIVQSNLSYNNDQALVTTIIFQPKTIEYMN